MSDLTDIPAEVIALAEAAARAAVAWVDERPRVVRADRTAPGGNAYVAAIRLVADWQANSSTHGGPLTAAVEALPESPGGSALAAALRAWADELDPGGNAPLGPESPGGNAPLGPESPRGNAPLGPESPGTDRTADPSAWVWTDVTTYAYPEAPGGNAYAWLAGWRHYCAEKRGALVILGGADTDRCNCNEREAGGAK